MQETLYIRLRVLPLCPSSKSKIQLRQLVLKSLNVAKSPKQPLVSFDHYIRLTSWCFVDKDRQFQEVSRAHNATASLRK